MKKLALFVFLLIGFAASAMDKDTTTVYHLADSAKAFQFESEIKVSGISYGKKMNAGILADGVKIYFQSDKNGNEIVFGFPKSASLLVSGVDTRLEKGELHFKYDWSNAQGNRLLIITAKDSAGNFGIYSGYTWLAKENKWKFIGTCRIEGSWSFISDLFTFYSGDDKNLSVDFSEILCLQVNGKWKDLKTGTLPVNAINLYGHFDSLAENKIEIAKIQQLIKSGIIDADKNQQNVFYKILKEGTGAQVAVTDTVTAYYHVSLLGDTSTIDQAKDKPAIFPLDRLIDGWKIGVPLLKVGGKIRMVVPSNLAYSIRTRSAKIPPNSILLFDVEVIDTKPAKPKAQLP